MKCDHRLEYITKLSNNGYLNKWLINPKKKKKKGLFTAVTMTSRRHLVDLGVRRYARVMARYYFIFFLFSA